MVAARAHDRPPVPATMPRPQATPFGRLLRTLRTRAGLSQNMLARLAGVDPAYVNRLERQAVLSPPSRRVVLGLWAALDADTQDRERLLVMAGHCPEVIVQAGGWDAYLDLARRRVYAVLDLLEGRGASGNGEPS